MEPPSKYRIQFVDESGYRLSSDASRRGMTAALDAQGAPPAEIVVLLAGDDRVRRLNHDFRGIDEATDVLTFPSGDGADGDIVIAVPYAERQARLRGVPLDVEFTYLAIHGALHLCGLDDATEAEADEMRRLMSRAAVAAGLPPDEAWGSLLHDREIAAR